MISLIREHPATRCLHYVSCCAVSDFIAKRFETLEHFYLFRAYVVVENALAMRCEAAQPRLFKSGTSTLNGSKRFDPSESVDHCDAILAGEYNVFFDS